MRERMQRYFLDFWNDTLGRQIALVEKKGAANPLITGLEFDSRAVTEGSVFFALRGLHSDGHAFINAALEKGAALIVHEDDIPAAGGALYLRVKNSRFAMSAFAAAFYNEPSRHLHVIGVTGTEGKSTTVYLIFQLLRLAGKKCGFISTVQYSIDGTESANPEHQTTPEATIIHRQLAEMLEHGVEYAVLEASSHGLSDKTNRLGNVDFDVAVMTNVTHEHLEFHGSLENYRYDKANLFRTLDRVSHTKQIGGRQKTIEPFGVINACDSSAAYFRQAAKARTISFDAAGGSADFSITALESRADGNSCVVKTQSGQSFYQQDTLPGAFNCGNVLAALIVVSQLLEKPIQELCLLADKLQPVRGRMTTIHKGQPFEVIVDYAHTPSSFETIFPPLRARLDQSGGRIISLFGSGGERDTQKRPLQGKIAGHWSDIVVLADEDPRGEDPMAILEQIAQGIDNKEAEKSLFLIPDRPLAIRKAFSLASPGDLVLLLGKGHENSIIYTRGNKATIKYDEITEAEKALFEMGYAE